MAHVSNIAKALAEAASAPSDAPYPVVVDDGHTPPARAASTDDDADPAVPGIAVVPGGDMDMDIDAHLGTVPPSIPLSKGALSGLDASAAITPALLAKDYLPGIMLGNGPRPIRYVMGELTHSVPGFSRIPPARARRLVVAALESRVGGGPDGNVAFFKTGWGRWDAQVMPSCRDSGVGSFGDGHMSPPRSELSGYAFSNGDSGVHIPRPHIASAAAHRRSDNHHHHHRPDRHCSHGSWTASSLREEDEDMDMLEHEADKMSLDGVSVAPSSMSSSSGTSDATDDDDWAAAGVAALRKASLPRPDAPRWNYRAYHVARPRSSREWSRRSSAHSQRPPLPSTSTSLPTNGRGIDIARRPRAKPALASPEERAAVAALLSLGASS